jgi:hypothetical protein
LGKGGGGAPNLFYFRLAMQSLSFHHAIKGGVGPAMWSAVRPSQGGGSGDDDGGGGESVTESGGGVGESAAGRVPVLAGGGGGGGGGHALVLSNMVTASELEDAEEHADILADVRTECEAVAGGDGAVLSVVIPRPGDGETKVSAVLQGGGAVSLGSSGGGVGSVFVLFAAAEGAAAARQV